MLDLFYPVYHKTKVILPEISISVYPRPQQYTMLNKSPSIQSFSFNFFYHKNLIKIFALGLPRQYNQGGATEDNNQDFVKGCPTKLFLYLISSVRVVSVSLTEANNQNFARGYPM